MTSDSQTSTKGRQHDDHCAAKEIHDSKDWIDWPAHVEPKMTNGSDLDRHFAATAEVVDPAYVICKSNEIEHLYWGAGKWGALAKATRYTHDTVLATREPKDGFWTTLDRAKELEQ